MPYTKEDYPDSLKNFPEKERNKIIDILNALLREGYSEDHAIPIATKQGKEWYEDHKEENKNS